MIRDHLQSRSSPRSYRQWYGDDGVVDEDTELESPVCLLTNDGSVRSRFPFPVLPPLPRWWGSPPAKVRFWGGGVN